MIIHNRGMKPITFTHRASMTGFGRGEAVGDMIMVITEIRSVNHRFLDLVLRIPPSFSSLEDDIRKCIRRFVQRGHLEVTMILKKEGNESKKVCIDQELLQGYLAESTRLIDLGLVVGPVSISDVLKKQELWKVEEKTFDTELHKSLIEASLSQALERLVHMRLAEGQALAVDLAQMLEQVKQTVGKIQSVAPLAVQQYRERLQQRIEELSLLSEPLEDRLLTEVALFADRIDITEEITRLFSHIEQFLVTLQSPEPVGRKLDFYLQEMNREINTISSKSNHGQVSNWVVEGKSMLEKMKEQVQNLE